jgi:RNA polymerase sigma-70 factor (ECF subfamily)
MIDRMNFPLVIRDMSRPDRREADGVQSLMNEDEFCAFYERTARPLWAYLSRITGDSQKAEDYLQEAYYRFYRAGAQYESEAHRRNSLFRIATNVVRDAARRRRLYEEVPLGDEWSVTAAVPVSGSPSPERQVAMKTDVARAMEKLEPAQRELLWLAYAQGSSHEEIAAILGLRAISVRTLLFRARQKLASLLKGAER